MAVPASNAALAGVVYFGVHAAGWPRWGFGVAGVAAALLASRVRRALRTATGNGPDTPVGYRTEAAGGALPQPAPEVVALVVQGRKIHAIKRYRELNPGIGLKQAKDVIDAL